jgi:hypothetical protein
MADFIVTDCGSVMTIKAVTDAAKEFAEENFLVESWMGHPVHFTADWRVATDLAIQLRADGFDIGEG